MQKITDICNANDALKGYIGVMNVETGQIVSLPKRQKISIENVCKLQEQIIYNIIFSDIKAISFKIQDVKIEQPVVAELRKYVAEDDKRRRAAHAEHKQETLNELAKRAETLPFDTAQVYNKLDTNAKRVFWGILDEQGDEINTRSQISERAGISLQKIDRSLTVLNEFGLIKREGSKKKGRYVIGMPIDKTASCASCKLKDKCDYTGAEIGNCAKFR